MHTNANRAGYLELDGSLVGDLLPRWVEQQFSFLNKCKIFTALCPLNPSADFLQ